MLADIAAAARAPEAERPGRVAAAIAPYRRCPTCWRRGPAPAIRSAMCATCCTPTRPVATRWWRWPAAGADEPGARPPYLVRPGRVPWHADGRALRPRHQRHPRQTGSVLRPRGATCHGPADPELIHRLANLSGEEAVSIHVYGVPYERFGADVNLVYAD
ncbi:cysteine dioxygenase [Teichococcus aestuarii]|uniref:cysteine dioxygenase n=1 Tax=Teichococcus aestuarii TaxID=568898 RepID=UPI003616CDC0